MSANELLLWMSAKGSGSWPQFRGAVEELRIQVDESVDKSDALSANEFGLPVYQLLQLNLQRLGHAEFWAGAGESDWRIAPPVLACNQPLHGVIGVLCGARTDLIFSHATQAPGVIISTQPGAPDAICVQAKNLHELTGIASEIGVRVQLDAPTAILLCLPRLDDKAIGQEQDVPLGADWRVDRFRSEAQKWIASNVDEARRARFGLFRFLLNHRREFYFCHNKRFFKVPGQVGKYLALRVRKRRVLRYEAESCRLIVPASCRPPFLIERALVLCSGVLPSYSAESRMLRYEQIPESVANLATHLLCQEGA